MNPLYFIAPILLIILLITALTGKIPLRDETGTRKIKDEQQTKNAN